MASDSKRNLGIDVLRVVCILYIVGYWHLVPYTQGYPGYASFITEAIKDSALGVFVFCSGYLLALREVRLTPVGLWDFYVRRLVRIYPLYALALLLFALFGLAGSANLWQAAALLSMFLPPAPYTLWFITMIMAFYLIAPLLIRLASTLWVYFVLFAVMMGGIITYHSYVNATDVRMLMFLPAFAFGVLYARNGKFQAQMRRYRYAWVLLLAPAYYLFAQQHGHSLETALGRIPLVIAGTAVAFLFVGPFARFMPAKPIFWLSYASFGLYLFHRVVFHLAIGLYFPDTPFWRLLYLLCLVMPLALIFAYAAQRLNDRLLSRV